MSLEVRENIGIAVDGGGIRGVMVAQGLRQLEIELDVERLIDEPRLKVIAGTSTGAIIAAAVALGFSATEIVKLYEELGTKVFSKMGKIGPFGWSLGWFRFLFWPIVYPIWLTRTSGPSLYRNFADAFLLLMLPSRYSADPLRDALREQLTAKGLPTNITLEEFANHLETNDHKDFRLIITTSDPIARQTQFLKTHSTNAIQAEPNASSQKRKQVRAKNGLVKVVMASAAIPTYFPPVPLEVPDMDGNQRTRDMVDGGVGSFANPAAVVAWEFSSHFKANAGANTDHAEDPCNVTVFSFGTGYIPDDVYSEKHGRPGGWWALNWVRRAIDIFIGDATREHSQNIVCQYPGIDLRRFQMELDRNIDPDRVNQQTIDELKALGGPVGSGKTLADYVHLNKHALVQNPADRQDPEQIYDEDIEGCIMDCV